MQSFQRVATFTDPGAGSFTIPSNVSVIFVTATGGGGGGGAGAFLRPQFFPDLEALVTGAGGGSGYFVSSMYSVESATQRELNIFVGSGGAGGVAVENSPTEQAPVFLNAGGDGRNSTVSGFFGTMFAGGGQGGKNVSLSLSDSETVATLTAIGGAGSYGGQGANLQLLRAISATFIENLQGGIGSFSAPTDGCFNCTRPPFEVVEGARGGGADNPNGGAGGNGGNATKTFTSNNGSPGQNGQVTIWY